MIKSDPQIQSYSIIVKKFITSSMLSNLLSLLKIIQQFKRLTTLLKWGLSHWAIKSKYIGAHLCRYCIHWEQLSLSTLEQSEIPRQVGGIISITHSKWSYRRMPPPELTTHIYYTTIGVAHRSHSLIYSYQRLLIISVH